MKAWRITSLHYCEWATVVFAETRGKAKAVALTTDAFEESDFTDISARRIPELDRYYRGKDEMDWDNMEDRIGMVMYAHMYCSDEMSPDELGCAKCPAEQWCSAPEDWEDNNVK